MDNILKEFVFKQEAQGTSKRSNKPYRMIELHDPQTLENTKFFLREGSKLDTRGLKFKDRVIASFTAEMVYGRLEFVLNDLQLAPEHATV